MIILKRAEPGLGIGIGTGRFFTKSEKIGKSGFLLPVFPLKIFFGTLFVQFNQKTVCKISVVLIILLSNFQFLT